MNTIWIRSRRDKPFRQILLYVGAEKRDGYRSDANILLRIQYYGFISSYRRWLGACCFLREWFLVYISHYMPHGLLSNPSFSRSYGRDGMFLCKPLALF